MIGADRPARDLVLPEEMFVIPDGERFLLYAPFTMGVASVNDATVRRLQQVKEGRAPSGAFPPGVLDALAEAGILTGPEQAGRKKPVSEKSGYDPPELTLFLTTRCTLACSYCYASGGDRPRTMSWETAKAGIDWMMRHAAARRRDQVRLAFHGGGEVTAAWGLLRRCIEYARSEAAARGMLLATSAALNGVMAGPLLEWVLANIDQGVVSLDGLPEVHDAQRPLVNGKGSFAVVAAALRRMDEVGFKYGLRTTVTSLSLPRMAEAVHFMCRNFQARIVQLEPVEVSGRATTNAVEFPDPQEFVRQFRAARGIAHACGRELRYSGARFGSVNPGFCQVGDDLLALTTDGFVSSCYEVCDRDDPRAGMFFYGRLNPETRDLEIDLEKLGRLRTLTVEHKASCAACFCRWSCGGECSAKLARAGDAWDASRSPRCIINRELTLDQIREYLERGGEADHPAGEPGS